MKIKELKELELREKLVKYIGMEMWNKATKIWKDQVQFDNFSWWKKHTKFNRYDKEIKEVYNKLMDKELDELKRSK